MRTPPVVVAAMLLVLSGCSGGSSDSPAGPRCGDGLREGPEQCDDGNVANLDGCDASCRFEQVLRAGHLELDFSGTVCPENVFGEAVVAPAAQGLVAASLDDAVVTGRLGWLLWIRNLDDLTGAVDPAVEVAVLSAGVHPSELAFVNAAQRDGWFMEDGRTLDASRVPRARLAGAFSGGALAAGPGKVPFPMSFLGELALLDVVDARISFQASGLSAPAVSAGDVSPGHLPSEHLSSSLQSFSSAENGALCGGIGARSLATVPLASLLASSCAYPSDGTFLDLLVGGCNPLSLAAQPDRVDPAAPVLGAGGPYHLVFDAGAKRVTACQDAQGVLVDLDGCLAAAAFSSAFTFTADRVIVRPGCGDGAVGSGEACDDGNVYPDDGCSSCAVDAGWTCAGAPSVCTTPCGDGHLDAGERCDDGNRFDLDGCSSTCAVEEGYTCAGVPSVCAGTCGDGIPVGPEACDDGNTIPGDGCSPACTREPGFYCDGVPTYCWTVCGDAEVAGPEQCDDGNGDAGDGCDRFCQLEAGWTCTGSPSACTDFCASCDDGVYCTADTCDAQQLVCAHAPLANGTSCPGNGVCQSGACVVVP